MLTAIHLPRRRAGLLFPLGVMSLGLLTLAAGVAAAQDASKWDGDARYPVRLIAGSAAGSAMPQRAGIELRLKGGWHTYWRYPGDAGVPPRFDFAGSQNVKSVDVKWPAPRTITEHGLTAIGYTGNMIWPLAVVPQDRTRPVTLRLKLDYAVCEKLCVPAEATAELVLNDKNSKGAGSKGSSQQLSSVQGLMSQAPSPQEAALLAAEARVPKTLALGEGATLAVRSLRRVDGTPHARVIVDVAAPPGTDVALFAEGPSAEWALPVPSAIDGAPAGLKRFAFDLDGAPPGATYTGAAIRLTAVAGEEAIEVVTHLD
jgi:DsbC/DsbD-like thiol-disulfide interchange protein